MKIKKKDKITVSAVSLIALVCAVILSLSFIIDARRERYVNDIQSSVGSAEAAVYNFLLLGRDRASGLTDVMMLVSVDIGQSAVNIIQIPRDTYARYTERGYRKLNGAMSALGGGAGLCDFLSDAMSIDIEGYFAFDLDAFAEAVDAIGGVEIDLPFDMDYDDPYQNLSIHLKAGKQTLDGRAAEQFVRYRSGYIRGDLGRMDAQKIFLSALAGQVLGSMTPATFIKTAAVLIGDIDTDISLERIAEIAVCMFDIDTRNIKLLTLAGEDVRVRDGGAWFYVISKSAAARALSEYTGKAVPYDDFDRDGLFVNFSSESLKEIYFSDIEYFPSSVSDINQNGIEIQKY